MAAASASGGARGEAKKGAAEGDPCNVTFQFTGEDHTLGNTLRYMLMKSPDVEFAGYSVPHPSEPYMNLRVQTHEGSPAGEAVSEALDNIIAACDHVGKTYRKAVKAHTKASQQQQELRAMD